MTLILNGTDNSASTPAVTGTAANTGIYYPNTSQVAVSTNGTQALIVDASQNVGIGTASPTVRLTVSGAVSATGNITGNYILGNGSQLTGVASGASSNISNGTSNVTVVSSGGNITVGVGGTANVAVFATTGEYITGLLSVTGGTNIGGNVGINGSPVYKFDVGIASSTQSTNVGSNGLIRNATAADQSPYTQARMIVYGGPGVDTANWGYFAYGADAAMRMVYAKTGAGGPLIFGTTSNLDGTGTLTETMRLTTAGALSVTGAITVNSSSQATAIVNGAANATGNIGSSTTYFNRLFAQATTALYADLAEMYTTDAEYKPGTVMIFGGTQEVTVSTVTHDYRVAGVVSTNPAHIMNSGLQGKHVVALALTGRVPVSVVGNISPGDRVVTSSQAGVAEALDMTCYQPGVIIGKALQSHTGDEVGVIEVVVGRL